MKAFWTSTSIFLSFALYSNFLYAEPKIAKAPLTVVVYATRIGTNSWVGKETATGYITKIDDHYVALPYRPLTSKIRDLRQQGRDNPYWVKLEYNGKSTTVPVEELGPWNWYDNYWALENKREVYSHLCHSDFGKTLPQGLPMAQAACINGDDFTNRSCDSTTKFNDGYTDCQERRL